MRLRTGVRSPWNHNEVATLREATAAARSPDRNTAAWCHRCHQHRVGELPPWPELCETPAADYPRSGSRPHGYQDAGGATLEAAPFRGAPALPPGGGRQYPERGPKIKVPGFKRQRTGGTLPAVGTQRLPWKTFRKKTDGDEAMSKAELLATIPPSVRPGERKPLPVCAVKLIQQFHAHEHFLRLIGDCMPVPEAGRIALGCKSPTTAYERERQLEAAGGPTALFRGEAVELFRARRIPWGNLIEDGGWARPFFARLAGGPESLAAIARDCRNEAQLRATIVQRTKADDLGTVQVLLFAQHSGLLRDIGREDR